MCTAPLASMQHIQTPDDCTPYSTCPIVPQTNWIDWYACPLLISLICSIHTISLSVNLSVLPIYVIHVRLVTLPCIVLHTHTPHMPHTHARRFVQFSPGEDDKELWRARLQRVLTADGLKQRAAKASIIQKCYRNWKLRRGLYAAAKVYRKEVCACVCSCVCVCLDVCAFLSLSTFNHNCAHASL